MSITVESDKKIIYLDHASTTPLDEDSLRVMTSLLKNKYANASSIYKKGREIKSILEDYRQRAANLLDVLSEEIIFTGSGTESDNLAILGFSRANKEHGKHIIISAIEHKAVLMSAKQLEKEGFEVTVLSVNKEGLIDINECLKSIKKDTILISIIYANNEIGTIEPIKELSKKIREKYSEFPIIHTDACQAAGLIEIKPKELGVDLMTLNSSKIYGPKGVGLLYRRKNIKINPIIFGGDQEMRLRAGTENVALIAGFVTALEKAESKKKEESKRLKELRDFFIKELKKEIPNIILNGYYHSPPRSAGRGKDLIKSSSEKRLANNVHVSIPNVEGESILLLLDEKGIMASTGSACSALDLVPSYVLLAIGQNEDLIHGSLRFTLGRSTTKKDLKYVVKELSDIVKHLSKISALTTKVYEKRKK